MKISRKFINDYIALPKEVSIHDLAEAMTKVGNEYESAGAFCSATNLVVGYVKECIAHPDSDHLHVCQVEIKEGEVVQIVCGAPNVKAGIKVIVSLPGAKLPGGIEIKKGMIRGQESNGMICSLGELGIESKYQTEEDKSGIHILDNDAPVGMDALAYLEYDDEVIDFELTSNRADLMSMIGMAYEIGAIYHLPVTLPSNKIEKEVEDVHDYISLSVETETCPLYLARVAKDVVIKESPKWMKERLMACGIRPINNVVDISNYVMLEYGQPLHFFDYDTLGKEIHVRMAYDKEMLTTLDGQQRILHDENIVIADPEKAVCLAGVMGGLNTEVEKTTTKIVIESAIFSPYYTRRTAKEILRSEASSRFEKGLDPNRTYMAIERACSLLEQLANATIIKGIVAHDKIDKEEKKIAITKEKINHVLGMKLTMEEIIDVFTRLDFKTQVEEDTIHVTVPSRRVDISIEEDLIEEVGRIHGIDQLEEKLPLISSEPGSYERKYRKEKEIKGRLEALGLSEVVTYTLTGKEHLSEFTNDTFDAIKMQDPLSEDKMYMRHSLLPSLLQVASYNLSRKNKDIAIYEVSDVYYFENNKTKIKSLVSGLLTGKMIHNTWQHQEIKADFYYAKGIVENLLQYLGLSSRYSFETCDTPKEYHPYQSAKIILDRDVIGYIGMVHPKLSKVPLYVFEIDYGFILDKQIRSIKDKEFSKYPSIVKDVAFAFDEKVLAIDVMKTIQKAAGRLLLGIEVFDLYQGENIQSGKKSLAFSLTFQDFTRTLQEEEVMVLFNRVIEAVEKNHQGELRDK